MPQEKENKQQQPPPPNKTFFQPAMYLFDKENLTKSPITS